MTVDTSTPSGKLVFVLFALQAEFKRDLLSERTRAGVGRVAGGVAARGRSAGHIPTSPICRQRSPVAPGGEVT